MKADVANLQLEAGAEYEVNLVFSDAAGEAVSLAEARLEAYLKPSGGEAMELSISVPADDSGLATVALPGQEIGMGAWEVWLTLSEGAARELVIRGLVTVAASVNARAEGNPATHRLLVRLGDQVSATLESVDLAWWAWDKCKKAAAGVIDALARLSFNIGQVQSGAEASATLRQGEPGAFQLDLTLPQGPQGEQGPQGPKGEKGEVPDNVVTTDTAQTVSGDKTFSGFTRFNNMLGVGFTSETCLIGRGLDEGYVEVVSAGGATDLQITYRPERFTASDDSVLTMRENDGRYAPGGHVDDAVVHVTAAERATLVKMIEVDSADDIPAEGETCNARHCYCVRRDAVAAVAATGSIVIGDDAPLSDEIIRINGVEMTISGAGGPIFLKAAEFMTIINNSGCGVTASYSSDGGDMATINLTANEAGSAGNGIAVEMIDYRDIGNEFSNDIITWTPMLSGGVDGVDGGVDMYVWGTAGWVQVNVDKLGALTAKADALLALLTPAEV